MADQLEQHIQESKNAPAKPKLFKKHEFGNDTQEAFNVFEAEHKLAEMEREIRHEFLYGAFCNLEGGFGGMDGYRKFLEMRRKIRADRIKMKQDQENAEAEFWAKVQLYGGGTAIVVIGVLILWMAVDLIFRFS